MIHPYQGYLTHFPERHFRFNELIEVYENQIAAGLERCTGRELFADELSCFCFWLVNNPESGSADWSKTKDLMTAFRFNLETVEDFKQEFKSLLKSHSMKGELN